MQGQALLLAIDTHLLPINRNLSLYYSTPQTRPEPLLTPSRDDPSKPDYIASHFYGTVLFDQGKYRMWYYAKFQERAKPHESSMTCYAESDDGIRWRKPSLGQKLVGGSRSNNAIDLPGIQTYGACVIKDEEDPDSRRRYKMVYNPLQESGPVADRFGQPVSTIGTATSPDGISWTARTDWPVDVFCEESSFFKHDGMYVVHGQGIFYGGGEGGRDGSARSGTTAITRTFCRIF